MKDTQNDTHNSAQNSKSDIHNSALFRKKVALNNGTFKYLNMPLFFT